jgi:hypothetical protein
LVLFRMEPKERKADFINESMDIAANGHKAL